MITPEELVVDNFAGGGGATEGIEQAIGRPADIAVNHCPQAIAMHTANHPDTRHFCESIYAVDPREACGGRRVGLAWFSPDCTHFSRAKGGTPRSKEIRGLAWVVVRWARSVRPRIILLENVEEFQTWGPLDDSGQPDKARTGETFREWVGTLTGLGYTVEFRSLIAADYGAPTTRRRLFMVARRDGAALWPGATHGVGTERPWRTASEIIDWSVPCRSIFGRKRPLAPATLRRIAAGIKRYVLEAQRPFVIPVTHPRDARVHGLDEPLRTITAAHRGEFALVTPFVSAYYGQGTGRRADEPLATVPAGAVHHALVAPTLIQTGYGERPGQAPRVPGLGRPLGTLVNGQKHGLVAAFLSKHFGGPNGKQTPGSPLHDPTGTLTTQDHHGLTAAWLMKYQGTSTGSELGEPAPTVTAGGGHLALVRAFLREHGASSSVELGGERYEIVDIGMRMLEPRELFRAQGFGDHYKIDVEYQGKPLTKEWQIALVGNSVSPPVAKELVLANTGRAQERAA